MKKKYEAPRACLDSVYVKDIITLSCEDGGTGTVVIWPGTGSGL